MTQSPFQSPMTATVDPPEHGDLSPYMGSGAGQQHNQQVSLPESNLLSAMQFSQLGRDNDSAPALDTVAPSEFRGHQAHGN
jgi:hypothetical protein